MKSIKNNYTSPSLEIYKISAEDVIATSGFLGAEDDFSRTTPASEDYEEMYCVSLANYGL